MTRQAQVLAFALVLLGGVVPCHAGGDVYPKLTRSSFNSAAGSKGVVLLAVRWDRRWGCADYENAQLRVIGFDRLPSSKSDQNRPDILLDDAPRLMTKPEFDNYALLVDPGEYGLSGFMIKVAKSTTAVDYISAERSNLYKDGKPVGGSFVVAAGEVVYIGNFYLDCYKSPTLWRYYSEGRTGFEKHMAEFKHEYPYLDTTKTIYRLFETKSFGNHYELP